MNVSSTTIEGLLTRMNEAADGTNRAVGGSLCWTAGMALANAITRVTRMGDDADPFYSKRKWTSDEQAEAILNAEVRVDELKTIVGYFSGLANDQYRPTGETIVNLMSTPRELPKDPEADQERAEKLAEEAGITVKAAMEAILENKDVRAEANELQRQAVERDRASLILQIDQALKQDIAEVEFTADDATRFIEKVAVKAEQYAKGRARQADLTLREMRRATLLSECRLLIAVANDADKLVAEINRAKDASRDRAPVENVG